MRAFAIAVIASLAACSSGAGSTTSGGTTGSASGALDCNWIQGSNCYKTVVAAAQGCLPPSLTIEGTLAETGATCSYDGGTTVTFATPLMYPFPQEVPWSFTVTQPDGGLCLNYQTLPSGDGFTLQTSAGTVEESGTFSLKITCPDGTSFATAAQFDPTSCDGGLLAVPGTNSSYSPAGLSAGVPTNVSFSLDGTAEGTPQAVFACTTAD